MRRLANTEPLVGAQLSRAQRLQWFLSESTWDERQVQAERLSLLREDPATAPTSDGVLVIDETGDRKDGHYTAHVGRQYLANLGKIDNGVVSVTSLWADEGVYYPVDFEPYTPAHHFEKGKKDPQFRTKLKIAVELVRRAVHANIRFRAVVADSFYGEDRGVKQGLRALGVGYVLALKPSHAWWHPEGAIGSFQEAAQAARWQSAERPGRWVKVTRTFRDGSSQDWWALEVVTGLNAPNKQERVVIATTDPVTLPDLTTFYLATNLPAPGSQRAADSELAAASLEEVVRLYGLRMWVEQSYKHVKHAASLVAVSGQKRQGHPTALATGVLRLLVLLVSCQSPHCEPDGRGSRAIEARSSPPQQCSCSCSGNGGKKSAGKKEFDRRCPGRWRCGRYADGWSPGSCSGATGTAGLNCPHLLRCSSCSDGLNEDMPLLSIVQLDPKSTKYR